jgi:hypothetical protein
MNWNTTIRLIGILNRFYEIEIEKGKWRFDC